MTDHGLLNNLFWRITCDDFTNDTYLIPKPCGPYNAILMLYFLSNIMDHCTDRMHVAVVMEMAGLLDVGDRWSGIDMQSVKVKQLRTLWIKYWGYFGRPRGQKSTNSSSNGWWFYDVKRVIVAKFYSLSVRKWKWRILQYFTMTRYYVDSGVIQWNLFS